MVTWNKPIDEWIKINTDGSALENLGRLGTGGILRDKPGQMLMAIAANLGEGTNNKAEIEAAIFCLTWALELGYRSIVLEMDSNWWSNGLINKQALNVISCFP